MLNILLFMNDQQQWQSISGRSPARSPNIDRLAAQGMRFERPYATVALCCPQDQVLTRQGRSHRYIYR